MYNKYSVKSTPLSKNDELWFYLNHNKEFINTENVREHTINFIIDNNLFLDNLKKNNFNLDFVNYLKQIFNESSKKYKEKLIKYYFNSNISIDLIHYQYLLNDNFKEYHEIIKNNLEKDKYSIDKLIGFIYNLDRDKNITDILKYLKIVKYDIFKKVLSLNFIECIKYFIDVCDETFQEQDNLKNINFIINEKQIEETLFPILTNNNTKILRTCFN